MYKPFSTNVIYMTIILSLAMIIGLLNAYLAVTKAHRGIGNDRVPSSNSLMEFIFLNK